MSASGIVSGVGALLNVAGVLVLYRYGIPRPNRTGGAIHLVLEQPDSAETALERKYDRMGHGALLLIVLGSVVQAVGGFMS